MKFSKLADEICLLESPWDSAIKCQFLDKEWTSHFSRHICNLHSRTDNVFGLVGKIEERNCGSGYKGMVWKKILSKKMRRRFKQVSVEQETKIEGETISGSLELKSENSPEKQCDIKVIHKHKRKVSKSSSKSMFVFF